MSDIQLDPAARARRGSRRSVLGAALLGLAPTVAAAKKKKPKPCLAPGADLQAAIIQGGTVRLCEGTFSSPFRQDSGRRPVTVIGAGIGRTILRPSKDGESVVIQNGQDTKMTLRGVTITGAVDDCAVVTSGDLTIADSEVTGNRNSQSFRCAGIRGSGKLTMTKSRITDNVDTSGEGGAGLTLTASATLTDCVVSDNHASGPNDGNGHPTGSGGAILSHGILTLTRTTVTGNSAADVGGGIMSADILTLNQSEVSNNQAGTYGGGIFSTRILTVQQGSVVGRGAAGGGNTAPNGGGVYCTRSGSTGSATFAKGTKVTGNTATGAQHGATTRYGGGIFNEGATLTVADAGIVSGNTPDQIFDTASDA